MKIPTETEKILTDNKEQETWEASMLYVIHDAKNGMRDIMLS